MPKTVESLRFDSDLFGLQVGRIVLEDGDLGILECHPDLADISRTAYSGGFKLLYLFAPPTAPSSPEISSTSFLGTLVDQKVTYEMALSALDHGSICSRAFANSAVHIRRHDVGAGAEPSEDLLALAVVSGAHSRFNVDARVPRAGYQGMFHGWLRNSLNRTVADDVFVAHDRLTSKAVGFVTVQVRGNSVNIGLLSVSESYRRAGIASALLSRAALWALEQLGCVEGAALSVVTQGANTAACACYERFGFLPQTRQDVYHIWLPVDLPGPASQADCQPIPFCRQHLTGRELQLCAELFARGGLDSAGQYNVACSSLLQQQLGADCTRVLLVQSGTAALELAALLCDLQPGDEVILPSYTFASTANAFVLRGAVPVFVDVHPDSLCLDTRALEPAITPRTRVICAVHYAGAPCDMDPVMAVARRHGLKVVEDAAQGYLATYKGRPVGTIGDFGCFSFHYTKNVICGEGGALSVNRSEALARRALVLWEKGTNRYDFMMGRISKYEWVDVGSSFMPSELSCAVLLPQLQAAVALTARRRAHMRRYQQALSGLEASGLLRVGRAPDGSEGNAHIFFLLFASQALRERFQTGLRQRGVTAFTHYVALHASPAGRRFGRSVPADALPVSEHAETCLLRLPIWADLAPEQVDFICQAVVAIAAEVKIETEAAAIGSA